MPNDIQAMVMSTGYCSEYFSNPPNTSCLCFFRMTGAEAVLLKSVNLRSFSA